MTVKRDWRRPGKVRVVLEVTPDLKDALKNRAQALNLDVKSYLLHLIHQDTRRVIHTDPEFREGDTCPFCEGKLFMDGRMKCTVKDCNFNKVEWE